MNNILSTKKRKVVIVGAGAVGSTFCYALAQSGLVEDIALIDKNESLVQGQVLDLAHGQAFFPTISIRIGSKQDYADAQIIVITAGAAQKVNETRIQLLKKNATIVKSIIDDIVASKFNGVIVVASNPVDILTHIALKHSGLERGKVIGSGTVLDSARFRHLLSQHCGVDIHNIHAYILGEHGDSEFAAWSMTHVAGMQIDKYCPICSTCNNWNEERKAIENNVKKSAYHIIEYKGATYFAIGLALVRIVGTILRDERSVLTVSTELNGEFGITDICLSVPSIVSANGVVKILEHQFPDNELNALVKSANILKNALKEIEES